MSTDHAEQHGTRRDRVFQLLKDGEWHAHHELARVGGVRYGARVRELKRMGYVIETKDVHLGVDGNLYRMPSTEKGVPAGKMVKVYLEEEDVALLLTIMTTPRISKALTDALGSFRENKHKL